MMMRVRKHLTIQAKPSTWKEIEKALNSLVLKSPPKKVPTSVQIHKTNVMLRL